MAFGPRGVDHGVEGLGARLFEGNQFIDAADEERVAEVKAFATREFVECLEDGRFFGLDGGDGIEVSGVNAHGLVLSEALVIKEESPKLW